jgi:hypothetical protein
MEPRAPGPADRLAPALHRFRELLELRDRRIFGDNVFQDWVDEFNSDVA